jgi:mannose-6-phosphate isomerase-like protein (cupin superfamily)
LRLIAENNNNTLFKKEERKTMIRKANEMQSEVRNDMRGGKGAVTILHFFQKEEIKARCRLCSRLTLPPGASIGMHKHEAEDELFIIESGTGIIDAGHSKTEVNAGDAILTGNGEEHALINGGSEPLVVTAIIMCY